MNIPSNISQEMYDKAHGRLMHFIFTMPFLLSLLMVILVSTEVIGLTGVCVMGGIGAILPFVNQKDFKVVLDYEKNPE